MERIVIETDEETKDQLKTLAFKEGKTMKYLIAEAIQLILKRLKKEKS